jgi:hypothetical protein
MNRPIVTRTERKLLEVSRKIREAKPSISLADADILAVLGAFAALSTGVRTRGIDKRELIALLARLSNKEINDVLERHTP